MEHKPLLKIQYGRFYLSIPTDDELESVQFAIKWLQFWENYFKKLKEEESTEPCQDSKVSEPKVNQNG